jgi:hypothetical protein
MFYNEDVTRYVSTCLILNILQIFFSQKLQHFSPKMQKNLLSTLTLLFKRQGYRFYAPLNF